MATALRTDSADPFLGRSDFYVVGEILYSFATDTYTLTIPAGTLVLEQFAVVTEAMDGSPTLTIGDGDDADGFQDSTDLAPGTALSVTTPAVKLAEDAGNPYANGKYYPTADTMDFVWTKGTSPTTGRMIVGYRGLRVPNFGLAAGLTAAAAGTF